jgi:nucleoside-diphosphate-sugar epimerase
MRVFVAGATGVIGRRLVPLLVADGHVVAGMTRSADKADLLTRLGAAPVVCDVFDAGTLGAAVGDFAPEVVVHQLTDLPDDPADIEAHAAANARIRTEGTRNLIAAAAAAGAGRFVAQSVAWEIPGPGGDAVCEHERLVLDARGVVLRYGQLYGPGTYHEGRPPPPPRIHVDGAAARTAGLLEHPPGIVSVVEQ